MKPDKSTAIIKLVSGVSFSITPDGKIVKWNSDKEQPTEEEIQAKLKELQDAYDAKQYQRDRINEYPDLQECIHAILDGELTALQKKRSAVKDKFPKPE
jgi:hypothetical protein